MVGRAAYHPRGPNFTKAKSSAFFSVASDTPGGVVTFLKPPMLWEVAEHLFGVSEHLFPPREMNNYTQKMYIYTFSEVLFLGHLQVVFFKIIVDFCIDLMYNY